MKAGAKRGRAPPGIRAVIFDFDGTIVDSFHAAYATFKKFFESSGLRFMGEAEFRDRFTSDWKSFLKTLEKEYGVKFSVPDRAGEAYAQALAGLEVVPGVKEAIVKLRRRGVRLAVVSTSVGKAISDKLAQSGLEADLVISGYDLGVTDKLTLLSLALERLGIDSSRCVFVGDMEEDVLAGRGAGVMTLALATGFHTYDRLRALNPDAVVRDSRSLYREILSLSRRAKRG